MAAQDPFKISGGQTYIPEPMFSKTPRPEDQCRFIWFADGKLRHAYTKWKNTQFIHNELWSHHRLEPDVVWCYHMSLKGWCQSLRDYNGNTHINALLKGKDSELLCLPKDIELYNALLGD